MNKIAKAALSVAALSLTLTACGKGGDDYDYDVKGRVKFKQVDYDCHPRRQAASLSALTLPVKPVGGGKGGSKPGKSGGGVKSGKKPSSPKKIDKLPAVPDGPDVRRVEKPRRSCKTEYELFIKNRDGLFEQDVKPAHYEKCTKDENFPECTR